MYLKFNHKIKFLFFTFLFLSVFLNAQTLTYGDATTASISVAGEVDTYTFSGNAGDIIRIRMRGSSQGVDGCFKLLGPAGNLLSEECDDGGIVQLVAYTLPSTGFYSIIAQDHNDNDTGDYGLSLEVLNGTEGVKMVSCGDDILSSLDHWTEVDLYGLECAAGDQLMIQMRSTLSNVECRLELIDPSGNTVANEVTQTGLAIISAFTIPTNGRYTIAAYDGNGNDLGDYGISFQLLNDESCATPIDCGTTINNTFAQVAQVDAYTMNCVAGDQIVIRATDLGTSLEPNLILCDANGTDVVATMDSETAEINYNIPNSGSYNLIVRDDKGNDTGEYSLSLQVVNSEACAKFLDCGDNAFSTTLDEENEVDVYSFKANQGEIINVQMRGYLNGIDAFLKIYDTAGNLLASDYSNGSMASINDLVIPTEGLYTITAEDRNGNDTGEYGLSFHRVHLDLCPTSLSCDNSTSNGMIDHFAEMDLYEFTAEAGQIISFEMAEIDAGLEPMIRFYAPDGTLLVEEHKSFHVDVTDFVLPQTGRYTIVCLDKNGNDTGAYTLDFNLDFDNGTSVCSTCNDGVLNGTETGVDCGGPDCLECCPDAGMTCDDGDANTFDDVTDGNCGCAGEICPTSNVQCTVCPEDLVLNCSDFTASNPSSNLTMPSSLQGDGGFNMVIQFSEEIKVNGVCEFYNATFDNGCVGIITACFGRTLHLTPEFSTCQGPLPTLPFTITFNDELSIYFNENGEPSESSNNSAVANNPLVQEWLTAGLNSVTCNVQDFTHDFNPSTFDAVCDGVNSAAEVTQIVNFNWIDLCNNVVTCSASLTVNNEPPCPDAGMTCDDGDANTFDDVTDGNCGCAGEICPTSNVQCTVCPEDLVLNCSDFTASNPSSNLTMPSSLQGDGGFNMVIQFSEEIKVNGVCEFYNATFDNGCVGIITACFGRTLHLTPEFSTCQGPLPTLPFTITFNDELSIYFNENGEPSESSNNSAVANNPLVQEWLTAGLNSVTCNVQDFTHDFNPSTFDAVCDGVNSAAEVTQIVNFNWIDLCNNVVTCQASLTVVNDNEPPCPAEGTACDDFNPATENDAEDGNCNCIGTLIPPTPSECDELDLSSYQPVSYGGSNQDRGNIQVIEDNHGYLLTNNAWKAIPFDYTITSDTKIEFEFMSSQEAEIHGIGFENNLSMASSSGFLFQLYGTQAYGRQNFNDYSEEGIYKKYIIPVGQFYTGNASYMTFVMDDDAAPVDGNSLFRNIKVYEGTCADEEATVTGCGTGGISRDVWLDIPGYELSLIPWNTTADISDKMTKFEAPIDQADHYGTRMRGYICPPQSGNYTFWISSDDQGELWLSTDENPSNVQLIAEVEGWTYPQVWDKYAGQKSVEIYLEVGQSYYIEALHKEHEGLDNLAVGWEWPNGNLERPILGTHLSPFTEATTQSVDDPTANTNNGTAPSTNAVNNNVALVNINIYPNPATDAINIDLEDFLGQNISLQITNSVGQPVYQQSIDGLNQPVLNVDMSSASILNGIYNVFVVGEDGVTATQSFLIIK